MWLLAALVYAVAAPASIQGVSAATQISVQSVAAQYSLATSTVLPFPTATQSSSDTQKFLVSGWSLKQARIQDGADNLAFVTDPFPNGSPTGIPSQANTTTGGPVLRVTYPKGSFSHDTGGSQFINLWNTTDGSTFGSMMVSYEVAFDTTFDWVKGGKLPGLRGGLNGDGCSGGNQTDGTDCFSMRVMWRANADGEVYAYIPTPNNLCSDKNIICNSDFGTSISRGSFGFVSGRWNRVTMLLQLNNPPNVANGNVQLYFNDILAVSQQNLQIRSSSSLSANGMYFSTFFGGSDSSWATPETVHTYFRNIQMYGSSGVSTLAGATVKNSGTRHLAFSVPVSLLVLLIAVATTYI